MTIDVVRADQADRSRWDELVTQSPQGSIFHHLDFLEVMADHADATLHLLVGYKTDEVRGIFPVFESTIGPIRIVTSPPPGLGVAYLGPALLNYRKMKRRKTDLSTKRFIEGALSYIEREIDPQYARITTSWRFADPRPFEWAGFAVSPQFSYRVPAGDTDELLAHLTRSARRSITRNEDAPVTVERVDADGLGFVHETLADRFRTQGESFPLTIGYLRDVDAALPADSVRTYIASLEDTPAMGRIVLQADGCAAFWQGMASAQRTGSVPVGDLLAWHTMTDAIDHGASEFDLIGANTPRLCRYKAKFNPELVEYYTCEWAATGIGPLVELYKRIRFRRS